MGLVSVKPMVHVSHGILPWAAHRDVIALLHAFVPPGAVVQPTSHRLHLAATNRALDVVILDDVEPFESLRIRDHLAKCTARAVGAATFDVEPFRDKTPVGGIRRELGRGHDRAIRHIGKRSRWAPTREPAQ